MAEEILDGDYLRRQIKEKYDEQRWRLRQKYDEALRAIEHLEKRGCLDDRLDVKPPEGTQELETDG